MELFCQRSSKWGLFLPIVLIFSWLSALQKTDAYYSVYALCALTGIACLFHNSTGTKHLSSRSRKLLCVFSLLFSSATVGANYPLFLPFGLVSLFRCSLSLLGGAVVGYQILAAACLYTPESELVSPSSKNALRLFLFTFLFCSFIDILYLLFSAYPGTLTTDSISTLHQISTGQYNNTMPFWHTVSVGAFFRLGLTLLGDANAAVAFFHCIQILCLTVCFAYALMTLYQSGAPRWFLAAVFCLYAFLPYNIVYSVTLWKDVPFSASALLLVTALYRILRAVGSQPRNYLVFVLGTLGLCLMRTNGLAAVTVTALFFFLLLRKQQPRLMLMMVFLVVLCWFLTGPALSSLQVAPTDLVEAFAVPFQQIARVVALDRPLDTEELALLSQAFQLDKVRELYNPQTVDPIKFETFHRWNMPFIQEHLPEYLRLYLQLGLKYPGDYLAAWVEETKGYWNAGYPFWIYTNVVALNDLGLVAAASDNLISRLFAAAFRFLEIPEIFQCLYSIGLQVWILIGCCLVNALKKRPESLLSIPLIVLTVGLWLGSPVFAEFRYAYPMFLTAPFILGVTLLCPEKHS